jgi:predicted aldo/keto reductase-like oxidoreductase
VLLGSTGIEIEKNGFGALPIQRLPKAEAVALLRRAQAGGVDFFDTARYYTDSEEKLGEALAPVRSQVVLASKTGATTPAAFWQDLATSLELLRTDYLDLYQFHNPSQVWRPDDGSGLYEAALEARRQGKIRHIGITNHRLPLALEVVASGLYATLQYPFSYLASVEELKLVAATHKKGMGFIAMKGLSGGLIKNFLAANAFMIRYPGVIPIWGIQRETELSELLDYIKEPPAFTPERQAEVERDCQELQGDFCRGCGYCLPCPAGIDIPLAARMSFFMRRSADDSYLTPQVKASMANIPKCQHCRHCLTHCPYGLDVPRLLKENHTDYKAYTIGR